LETRLKLELQFFQLQNLAVIEFFHIFITVAKLNLK
jgi:hypothetical protein